MSMLRVYKINLKRRYISTDENNVLATHALVLVGVSVTVIQISVCCVMYYLQKNY